MTSQVEGSLKPMKCLSLKQPFAQLIVDGRKTIELRKWKTKFRGTFLVHASKVGMYEYFNEFGYSDIPQGAIIGKVDLLNVKHYESAKEWNHDSVMHLADDEFRDSLYGFILANPVKFEKPIPFAGSLNFFNVLFDEENLIAKQFIQEKLS